MKATRGKRPVPFYGAFVVTFLSGSAFLGVPPQLTLQSPGQQPSATVESVTTTDLYGNPCDTMMGTMKGMSVMGESMEAMTNHMCITAARPELSGDEDRAKALVDQVRTAIEKYKDYKKAIADGYIQANPTVDQPSFISPTTPTQNTPTPSSVPPAPLRCSTTTRRRSASFSKASCSPHAPMRPRTS